MRASLALSPPRAVSYTHLDVYKRQEHISLDGYPERLAVVVAEQKKQVEKLLASADEGKMIQVPLTLASQMM